MMKGKWVRLISVFFIFFILNTTSMASNNSDTEVWQDTSMEGTLTGRYGHTIIWTGEEMIVWGGYYHLDHFLNDGASYNPETDTWASISTENAPIGRLRHTVIWTGKEMIVWGGESGGGGTTTNTGGIYNPTTDTWTKITTENAPAAREMHSAVWTGEEMIIWGGCSTIYCSTEFNNGGKYNPDTDTWTPITSDATVIPRHFHQAVWTGDKMIVWGGSNDYKGMSYDPIANTWSAISTVNSPIPTYQGAGIWTGNEIIVWGGCTEWSTSPCSSYVNSGGIYNPVTDTWKQITTISAPNPRWTHTAVWTGLEMVIWGGCGDECYNTGGRYNPYANKWEALSTVNAPSARSNHKAIWTGKEMIIWGGCGSGGCGNVTYYNTGGLINIPVNKIFLPLVHR
ncbi:MAG: hypothetical protein J7L73_03305 [Anaerolineales bacterium]|nr:hypothetical protein [Anaerolineales bacterium]